MTVLIRVCKTCLYRSGGVHVRDGREIQLTRKLGMGDRPRGM